MSSPSVSVGGAGGVVVVMTPPDGDGATTLEHVGHSVSPAASSSPVSSSTIDQARRPGSTTTNASPLMSSMSLRSIRLPSMKMSTWLSRISPASTRKRSRVSSPSKRHGAAVTANWAATGGDSDGGADGGLLGGVDGGVLGGVDGGVDGGVLGGVEGGVLGGVDGGVDGGLEGGGEPVTGGGQSVSGGSGWPVSSAEDEAAALGVVEERAHDDRLGQRPAGDADRVVAGLASSRRPPACRRTCTRTTSGCRWPWPSTPSPT